MTDDKAPWFPCNPGKLLGALAEMKANKGYVYVIVLLRIYETGGPCRDTVEALSNRTKLHVKVVGEALDALFAEKRLIRTETGIMNPVAEKVLGEVNARREKRKTVGQKGGLRSAEKRQSKQQKRASKATHSVNQPSTQIQIQIQEQEQKKDRERVPIVSQSAVAEVATAESDSWPSDFRERFWAVYPRKAAKKTALEALDKVRKSKTVDFATVMLGVTRLIAKIKRERIAEKYIKHPATWLNGGCWDDEAGLFNGGEDLDGRTREGSGERLTHGVIAARLKASIASQQH